MSLRLTVLSALLLSALSTAIGAHADDVGSSSNTVINGLVYLDGYAAHSIQDYGSKAPGGPGDVDPQGLGFDVSRFYVGFYHSFDDTWSVKFLPFFTSTNTPGTPSWYLKEAYLQGKLDPWATFRVGNAPEPWVPFVEKIYGYRFVEQTFTEREGIANTADMGGHLSGAGDLLSYDVAIVNGGGYKNPQRTKAVDEEARIALTPIAGLTFAIGGYSGELGQDTLANETADAGLQKNTATRWDALAAWKADGLTLGGEYVQGRNFSSSLIFSDSTDTEAGYSLFGSYDLTQDYSVFARYDRYKPSEDTDSFREERYGNTGFAWKANANLTWALVYKYDRITDNLKLTNDGDSLMTQEVGIWAQVKF
ncbi:MAG TPA: hypothetical protein VGH91_09180 [Gammaproteobacteria bacterium]|jgi:hypothetical protein